MARYKLLLLPAALLLCFAIPISLDLSVSKTSDREFEKFTDSMFQNEVVSSTLNLHYTLMDPEEFGISSYAVTFGNTAPSLVTSPSINDYSQALSWISYQGLSKENQLTYDILSLYLANEKSGEAYAIYEEPLGATIGIQAQLPVLLAEYAFYSAQDIETYLQLISQTDSYFASLLEFERAKAASGLFMNDACADDIVSQCASFLEPAPEDNFLVTLFNEKTDAISSLSQEQRDAYQSRNLQAVTEHVLPAYRLLKKGILSLKGSGKNDKGLAGLPHGKLYYEYLLRRSTGSYLPVNAIENRIRQQLQEDLNQSRQLILEHPSLYQEVSFEALLSDPGEILSDLQTRMEEDFPLSQKVDYTVKYVHPSLENFLSPAFYLTPPIDNLLDNVIYINQAADYSPLELYTTLAHEGYPGHLYQNIYSGDSLTPVRSLLSFGGYTEGWATYVEMESYRYAADLVGDSEKEPAIELARLNRSVMLGLSSLLDICIHYQGYTLEDTQRFLENLGFQNSSAGDSIYNAILEAPANYLKYYLGYLTFLDLRSYCQERYKDQFELKDFHRRILEIGPCPFPVLEKYLKASYE